VRQKLQSDSWSNVQIVRDGRYLEAIGSKNSQTTKVAVDGESLIVRPAIGKRDRWTKFLGSLPEAPYLLRSVNLGSDVLIDTARPTHPPCARAIGAGRPAARLSPALS
jgi:hypothetical protein